MSTQQRPGFAPRSLSRALALALGVAGCNLVNVVPNEGMKLRPVEYALHAFDLPSGLRVIVERDTRTPLVGVFLVVGSGSASDPAGKEGLAHLVEHLSFRSRPFGNHTLADLLTQAGGVDQNARTTFDATTYSELGVASELSVMLRIESARMMNPVTGVTPEVHATELEVVRNELRERNESGFVGDALSPLQAQLFPASHPYARAVGGTNESLSAITPADVQAYAAAHYRPDNMTLVIAGNLDLDATDKVLEGVLPFTLTHASKKVVVPERMSPQPPPVPELPPAPAKLQRIVLPVTTAELWIAWSLPRGFDSENFLLDFSAEALDTALFQGIVDDHEDVISLHTRAIPGREASMLITHVQLASPDLAEKYLAKLLDEVPNVVVQQHASFGLNDFVFNRVRRKVLINQVLDAEQLSLRGRRRAMVTHFSRDPALFSHAVRDLDALTLPRARAFYEPFLTAARARAILIVPATDVGTGAALQAKDTEAPRGAQGVRDGRPKPEWFDALLSAPAPITYRLPNGLSVVLDHRAGLPILDASISYAVGTAIVQNPSSANLMRLREYPASHLNAPGDYGASGGSAFTMDSVVDAVVGASGNTENIIAALAERTRTMTVIATPGSYERAVLPQLARDQRDPSRQSHEAFMAALLPRETYGRRATKEDFIDVSDDRAIEWNRGVRTPHNGTLTIVGDFDEKMVRQWVEESFGEWETRAPIIVAPPGMKAATGEPVETRLLKTPRPGSSQAELRFGCLLPRASTGAVVATHRVAASVLKDRLWRLLRDTLGATYDVDVASVALQGGTAWLELSTNVANEKLAASLRTTHQTLLALAREPISADELAWGRMDRAAHVARSQMTNESVAALYHSRTTLGLAVEPAAIRAELDAVTADGVREALQSCLAANPIMAIVGDEAMVQEAWKSW